MVHLKSIYSSISRSYQQLSWMVVGLSYTVLCIWILQLLNLQPMVTIRVPLFFLRRVSVIFVVT